MKFLFRKLAGLREADRAAIQNSKALLEEAHRTDPAVDAEHEEALRRLREATEQANRLKSMDKQNHYSESLTQSFRGRTA
jgi:phosphate uptake regulator